MSIETGNHFTIKPKSPVCSYCGSKMNFTVKQVKRNVPQGAKDLGIYDDINCWQCQQCDGTVTKSLSNCECGRVTFDALAWADDSKKETVDNVEGGLYGLLLTEDSVWEDIDGQIQKSYDYKCIFCNSCPFCGKKLETPNFVQTSFVSTTEGYTEYYSYYHKDCFPVAQIADKQQSEQQKIKREVEEREKRHKTKQRKAKESAIPSLRSTILLAIVTYFIVGIGGCFIRDNNNFSAEYQQKYKKVSNSNMSQKPSNTSRKPSAEELLTGENPSNIALETSTRGSLLAFREEAVYAALAVLVFGILKIIFSLIIPKIIKGD